MRRGHRHRRPPPAAAGRGDSPRLVVVVIIIVQRRISAWSGENDGDNGRTGDTFVWQQQRFYTTMRRAQSHSNIKLNKKHIFPISNIMQLMLRRRSHATAHYSMENWHNIHGICVKVRGEWTKWSKTKWPRANRGVSHFYTACRIDELSRGSVLGYEIFTNN